MDWNACRLSCIRCRADCLEACQDINEFVQSSKHVDDSVNLLLVAVQKLGETCGAASEQIKALPLLATDDERPLRSINDHVTACQKILFRLDHVLGALRQVKKSFFKQAVRSKKDPPPSEVVQYLDQIDIITVNIQFSIQLLDFKGNHIVTGFADEMMLNKLTQLQTDRDLLHLKLDQKLARAADSYISRGEALCARNSVLAPFLGERQPQPASSADQQRSSIPANRTTASIRQQLPVARPSNVLSLDSADGPNLWGDIHCLAISSDHTQVAWGIGSEDGCSIEIRLLATGKLITTLKGTFNEVHCLCFDPQGVELASGHENGVIIAWSLESGRQTRWFQWRGPSRPARARTLSYMTQGAYLLSIHVDSELRVWELRTGKKAFRRKVTNHAVSSLDGRFIGAINHERVSAIAVKELFKVQSKAFYHELGSKGKHMAWSGDNRLAVECGFGKYQVFTSGLDKLGIVGPARSSELDWSLTSIALAFLPDASLVSVARDKEGIVYLCDVLGERWFRLQDDNLAVSQMVQLSPSGEVLITAQHGGRYCVYDVPKILEVTRVPAAYTEFYAPGAVV